jgi:hypothetical protein
MMVTCSKCDRRFDDEYRWTICPHNSLAVAHDASYCRRHDLYNCHLPHAEPASVPSTPGPLQPQPPQPSEVSTETGSGPKGDS